MEGDAKEQENQAEEQTNQEAAQGAVEGTQGAPEGDVKDSHGQPGINKERHDREVADLKEQIAALKAAADEAAEAKAKREEFKAKAEELDAKAKGLEAKLAETELAHKLEMAGCLDLKAAKSRLEDFGGDVKKLKEGCPYLFQQQKKGATGGKPAGSTDDAAARLAKAREIAGVTKK